MKKLKNYLKASRKNMGLTQKELSFLLGKTSVSAISKFENDKTTPDLKTAIEFRILYDSNLKRLWPKRYKEYEYFLVDRMDTLAGMLESGKDNKAKLKAVKLRECIYKVVNNQNI